MFRQRTGNSCSLAVVVDDDVDIDNNDRDHRGLAVDSTGRIITWLAGWIHIDRGTRIRSIIARCDLATACSNIWRDADGRSWGLSNIRSGICAATRFCDRDSNCWRSTEYRGIVVRRGKTRKERKRGGSGELHTVCGCCTLKVMRVKYRFNECPKKTEEEIMMK